MKTTYETGATSHAVNDLILFADNTRELTELRDKIYTKWATGELCPHSLHFNELLKASIAVYRSELGFKNSYHVANLTIDERIEFMDLYTSEYEIWKQEHSYN